MTTAVVGVGITLSGSPESLDPQETSGDLSAATGRDVSAAAADTDPGRMIAASRDAERRAVTKLVTPKVTGRLWATTDLDLRATPTPDARVLGEVKALTRVGVTGERNKGFAQVIVAAGGGRTIAWVTAEYLAAKKPEPAADPADQALSTAPCPDMSVENGLTDGAVRLYRAVCHAFPQVTQYGGWDAHGEHSSGKALDIMTSDVALGNAIAAFLRAHASELDIYDIIWRQHIWTPVRASEGWRAMPDRGSETANHYDHVHASVN